MLCIVNNAEHLAGLKFDELIKINVIIHQLQNFLMIFQTVYV